MIGTSDDVVFWAGLLTVVALLVLAVRERRAHRSRLAAIPLRISVNGSRGKSTVTRLATGALSAAGWRTLGKTTGTEARLIRGWDGGEVPVRRRPEGPNVGEQLGVVREAATHRVEALVAECMAITPEYQRVFHDELVDVNVLVLTNALADHLEEMGPTTADVAEVFGESIPAGGVVVIAPGPHRQRLRRAARRRGAAVIEADPSEVPDEVLQGFEHLVFAEHVALVLALTRYLGIPKAIALRGMRQASPDPFATRLVGVGDPEEPALLVNAFGANDPTSTLGVWQHVAALGHPSEGLVVVMNGRADRVPRTRQFAREVLPHLPIDTLVIAGRATGAVQDAVREGVVGAREVFDATGLGADPILRFLDPLLRARVVLCVGNLHGGGAEIVAGLEQRRVAAMQGQGTPH